jgi:hypothetical protein
MEKEHGTSMTPQKGVPFNSKPGQYNKTTHFAHTNLKMNLRNAKQTLNCFHLSIEFSVILIPKSYLFKFSSGSVAKSSKSV